MGSSCGVLLLLSCVLLFSLYCKAEPINIEKTVVFQIAKRLSAQTDNGGYYHMYVSTRDDRCCKVRVTIRANVAPETDSECCNPGKCNASNLCQ